MNRLIGKSYLLPDESVVLQCCLKLLFVVGLFLACPTNVVCLLLKAVYNKRNNFQQMVCLRLICSSQGRILFNWSTLLDQPLSIIYNSTFRLSHWFLWWVSSPYAISEFLIQNRTNNISNMQWEIFVCTLLKALVVFSLETNLIWIAWVTS